MGRRPTPTHLKLLRGNPGCRPINWNEPQPSLPAVPLPAPEWLGAYAREEWTRIAKELHCLRLLTAFDVMSLAAYCEAYSTWRRAGAMLEEQAAADPETGALTVTTRHGAVMQNPLVQTMRQAAADMVRYASEFGFTPASRSKISVIGARPGPGKFDGLLAD